MGNCRETCQTITTPQCDDSELCDFTVPSTCVTVAGSDCYTGGNLQEVLDWLCDNITGCTIPEWTALDIGGGTEQKAFITELCTGEVKTKGYLFIDDYVVGTAIASNFIAPDLLRRVSVNILDDDNETVLEAVLEILTDGSFKVYYNQAEATADPLSFRLFLDGLSYFK